MHEGVISFYATGDDLIGSNFLCFKRFVVLSWVAESTATSASGTISAHSREPVYATVFVPCQSTGHCFYVTVGLVALPLLEGSVSLHDSNFPG